eukprot:4698777-Amphidinium_carterae.1
METIASTFCRRPPCTTIFASSHNYAAHMGYRTKQFTKQYYEWLEDIGMQIRSREWCQYNHRA